MIEKPDDVEYARDGFLSLDELWLWLDSRESVRNRNKFMSDLLIKLRKRNLDLAYTAQHFGQVDKRLRNITNFLAVPELSPDESRCTLSVFEPFTKQLIRQYRFMTLPIFSLYRTNEEISRFDDMME